MDSRKLCFFFEGLPGSGKSNLIDMFGGEHQIVKEVSQEEDLEQYHNKPEQDFFLENDEYKIRKALEYRGTVFIDRSPLSTLFFNLAKFIIDNRHDPVPVIEWYRNRIVPQILGNGQFRFIYIDITPELSLLRKDRLPLFDDPWAHPGALSFVRQMYVTTARAQKDRFYIVDGSLSLEKIYSDINNHVRDITKEKA